MQAITGAVHFCFIVWPSTLSVEGKTDNVALRVISIFFFTFNYLVK